MAAEEAAATAAEMAAAEESVAADDIQSMDIEEESVVVNVAAELAGAQPMELSDDSDTQMGIEAIEAGDDDAEDGAGLFVVCCIFLHYPSIHILLLPFLSLNL